MIASERPVTGGLLSLQDVADHLGVPLGSVYQWRSRGHGPRGVKVGKHVRVRRADLDAWIDAHSDPIGGAA